MGGLWRFGEFQQCVQQGAQAGRGLVSVFDEQVGDGGHGHARHPVHLFGDAAGFQFRQRRTELQQR
ncbi:hypothetical protein GCM10028793_51070 [Nocardiopsis oceani]